jgi:hypothetical protein
VKVASAGFPLGKPPAAAVRATAFPSAYGTTKSPPSTTLTASPASSTTVAPASRSDSVRGPINVGAGAVVIGAGVVTRIGVAVALAVGVAVVLAMGVDDELADRAAELVPHAASGRVATKHHAAFTRIPHGRRGAGIRCICHGLSSHQLRTNLARLPRPTPSTSSEPPSTTDRYRSQGLRPRTPDLAPGCHRAAFPPLGEAEPSTSEPGCPDSQARPTGQLDSRAQTYSPRVTERREATPSSEAAVYTSCTHDNAKRPRTMRNAARASAQVSRRFGRVHAESHCQGVTRRSRARIRAGGGGAGSGRSPAHA